MRTRRNVDAIAQEVIALDNDVAEVDTHAEVHTAIIGQLAVALLEILLDFDGAAHSLDGASELGDDAVTGAPENPAMMVRDQPLDDLSVRVQRADSRFLVGLHEPAVADHVRAEDRGKSPFNFLPFHGSLRQPEWVVDRSVDKAGSSV